MLVQTIASLTIILFTVLWVGETQYWGYGACGWYGNYWGNGNGWYTGKKYL